MTTKLTLTIDNKIIIKAKMYASQQKRSLSDLVENYLKSLTHAESGDQDELTPAVRSLMGSFKTPADFDYKTVLSEARIKKHG
jgi:hypothetical protein